MNLQEELTRLVGTPDSLIIVLENTSIENLAYMLWDDELGHVFSEEEILEGLQSMLDE